MSKVLVLCTGNSCRSQMAHGYLTHFASAGHEIYSAGVETHGVNPGAIEVMAHDGVDISGHTSNHVDEYEAVNFDFIITVCDHAKERCPVFPTNASKYHQNFPDPAKATGSKEAIQESFEHTRDLIKTYCRQFAADHL